MRGKDAGWGGGMQGREDGREKDRRSYGRAQLGACPGRRGEAVPGRDCGAVQLGSRPSGSGTEASGLRAGECPQNTNKPLFILETRRKLGPGGDTDTQ